MSLIQSPNRLMEKAKMTKNIAGKKVIHHSPENKKSFPSLIKVPKEGVVGGTPTPRKLNVATLSFLGVGVPPTTPSLGTLIRLGNDFLFSGEWWITFFPAIFLVILAFSINLLGDWMRDTLNPKLKK